jgi:hypothetical protein
MATVNELKAELAIFSENNGLDLAAIPLIEKLIENNVSFDDAHKFCEEHFMSDVIAKHYQDFYSYILLKKQTETAKNITSKQANACSLIDDIIAKLEELKNLL